MRLEDILIMIPKLFDFAILVGKVYCRILILLLIVKYAEIKGLKMENILAYIAVVSLIMILVYDILHLVIIARILACIMIGAPAIIFYFVIVRPCINDLIQAFKES